MSTLEPVRGMAPEPSPEGLGPRGAKLWADMRANYDLRLDELEVLLSAAQTADRIDALEAELAGAPLLVEGPGGRQVSNPMLVEVRHCHATLASLLARLKLDVTEAPADVLAGSTAARRLVSRRRGRGGWGR